MVIGVNLIPLRPGIVGGAEVYIRDLLDALCTIDKTNRYVLATARYNHDSLALPFENVKRCLLYAEKISVTAALRWRRLLKRIFLKIKWVHRTFGHFRNDSLLGIIAANGIDLWFCPFGNLEPRRLCIPSVITVHDLQHEYHPEFFSEEELNHRKEFNRRSCSQATRIIAVSDFTKETIVEKYGVNPRNITPVWEAVGTWFRPEAAADRYPGVKEKYRLPDSYIYYPANIWHHKNHATLLKAFVIYKDREKSGLKLVLSGAQMEGSGSIEETLSSLRLRDEVLFLGFLPREDLPSLYWGAESLVFPSLFEGFGIPLLEAMSVGCPVIASHTTSIPEIVGDAAVFFDPAAPESIAEAMCTITKQPQFRKRLIEKGRERAAMFSWAETARKTLSVFDEAVKTFNHE